MIAVASTVVCPVVHTWLNWTAIGAFVFFGVAIVAAVAWSMYDHHSRLRAEHRRHLLQVDGSPAGESTGGHGSLRVPQASSKRDGRW